ncbi:MAG TPA: GNAT family N-acetyltransferase [Chloroflexota bacterium]|nr:GNAT family N-acetyltransferase [Chloroflexota bacterium]
MRVPTLETARLLVRELDRGDLAAVRQLLDVDLAETDAGEPIATLAERQRWLEWTIDSYLQLATLRQPPYGERAIVLKDSGELIGACGFVPCLAPFYRLPALRLAGVAAPGEGSVPEVGLYWAVSPAYQRQGYATEAASALISYAFGTLNLRRIVATTDYTNVASMGVMRKLGMRLERNPSPEPHWLQVVGVLDRTLLG